MPDFVRQERNTRFEPAPRLAAQMLLLLLSCIAELHPNLLLAELMVKVYPDGEPRIRGGHVG